MNNYFTLRRANRLRVKLLNSKSQEQIREVIRYLRRTSWDECGVELIYSDLIDMAVQDCVEQGIETLPPDKLAGMMEEWGCTK